MTGSTSPLVALVLALCGGAPIFGARTGPQALRATARGAILGQFALVTLASLALIYALVTTDFCVWAISRDHRSETW